jgi:hypothetical protein
MEHSKGDEHNGAKSDTISIVQQVAFTFTTEGVFWDVIGTKNLRLLLHAIHSHLHQLILLTFLGLVCIFSLFTFESSNVLSIITLYLYLNTSFSQAIIGNASKGEKTKQKTISPLWVQKSILNNQSMKKGLFMNIIL